MIRVITGKDNSFEANTGCETVLGDNNNDGDDGQTFQPAYPFSTTSLFVHNGIKGDDDTDEGDAGLVDTKALDDSCEPFEASVG